MHETLGETIAEQIRRYRRQRDISVRELAVECARIAPGTALTQGALTNIERGSDSAAKRGRREVTVDELFTLAAALRVPPILLMCPMTVAEIEIVPGTVLSPGGATAWIAGKQLPPLDRWGLTAEEKVEYEADYQRNSLAIRLAVQHEVAVGTALATVRHYNEALETRNVRLVALDAALENMRVITGRLVAAREADDDDLADELTIERVRLLSHQAEAGASMRWTHDQWTALRTDLVSSLESLVQVRTTMRSLGIEPDAVPGVLVRGAQQLRVDGLDDAVANASEPGSNLTGFSGSVALPGPGYSPDPVYGDGSGYGDGGYRPAYGPGYGPYPSDDDAPGHAGPMQGPYSAEGTRGYGLPMYGPDGAFGYADPPAYPVPDRRSLPRQDDDWLQETRDRDASTGSSSVGR